MEIRLLTKVLSVLLACQVFPVLPASASNDAEALAAKLRWDAVPNTYAVYPNTLQDNIISGYLVEYEPEGILVTSSDPAWFEAGKLGSFDITYSEGFWPHSIASLGDTDMIQYDQWPDRRTVLVQPVEGFLEKYGTLIGEPLSYEIGAVYQSNFDPSEYEDPLYLLTYSGNTDFVSAVLETEVLEPIGVLYGACMRIMYLEPDYPELQILPKEGCTVTAGELSAATGIPAEQFSYIENSVLRRPMWYVQIAEHKMGRTSEELAALRQSEKEEWLPLCGRLNELDSIEAAVLSGFVEESGLYDGYPGLKLVRVKPTAGDADGDGSITLQDASAILKQYNLTDILGEDGFMTDEQIAAADVDGDGAVTPKDASYIQKYINFAVILEEPKTWAEIIKK